MNTTRSALIEHIFDMCDIDKRPGGHGRESMFKWISGNYFKNKKYAQKYIIQPTTKKERKEHFRIMNENYEQYIEEYKQWLLNDVPDEDLMWIFESVVRDYYTSR